MRSVDYVLKMASVSGRNDKEEILRNAWNDGERNLFIGIRMAYDKLITFGVKKVAEIEGIDDDHFESTYTFDNFINLTNKLSKRELTGNAARDAIHQAASASRTDEWNNFYRLILLKDFKCGISETTVNKVLKEIGKKDKTALDFVTPVFECQLAHPSAKYPKKLKGKKFLDVKFDGMRLLTIVNIETKEVVQYTRNGNVNDNFEQIRRDFYELMPFLKQSLVFDSEVVGESFQDLMSQATRISEIDTSNAKLATFDVITFDEFKAGITTRSQRDRHEILCGFEPMFSKISDGRIYVIPKKEVDLDTEEGMTEFKEFETQIRQLALENPIIEGVMIKDVSAPYECKRTTNWLKLKPFITVTLTAVEFIEGEPGTKYVGQLGAVTFEGIDDGEGEGKFIRVNVGGGWSDKQRKQIWANRDKYRGMMGDIKADVITHSKTKDHYSLRFSSFKGWRGGKPGEKL